VSRSRTRSALRRGDGSRRPVNLGTRTRPALRRRDGPPRGPQARTRPTLRRGDGARLRKAGRGPELRFGAATDRPLHLTGPRPDPGFGPATDGAASQAPAPARASARRRTYACERGVRPRAALRRGDGPPCTADLAPETALRRGQRDEPWAGFEPCRASARRWIGMPCEPQDPDPIGASALWRPALWTVGRGPDPRSGVVTDRPRGRRDATRTRASAR
jgi:hypothetical protein